MVSLNVFCFLSLVIAFVAAHPLNDELAARHVGSVTSTHSASSSYRSLSKRIRTLRKNILAGKISVSEARSQFQSFASQASSTFSAINGCSVCYGGNSATSMSQSAQKTYSEFNSLVQTTNQVFGAQAPTVLSSFTQLDSQFKQNLQLFSQSGVSIQSIVPSTFTQTMSQAGMSQTSSFISHFSSGNGSSSVTSTTSASSSYRSLSTRIHALRDNIAAGKVTVSEARSQFQSFASQASSTFSAINGCSVCYGGNSATSMSQSAQQTYSELNSLVQTTNQVFGAQAPTVLSSFTKLDSQFKQNLELFSQSGVGLQSILPSTFTQTMSKAGMSQTSSFASHSSSGSAGF